MKYIPLTFKVDSGDASSITRYQFTIGNNGFTAACDYPEVNNANPSFTYNIPAPVSTKVIAGNAT